MHTVFVVIFVKVVSKAVVVVVKRCSDAFQQFLCVGQSVSVPIVVSPIDDTVVVVVPSGLFLTPEAAGQLFLIDVQTPIVVIVRVFTIGDTIVVVVNIVKAWNSKALGHDTTVPNRLIEAVVVCVGIVAVIVVVNAIVAGEEIPVVLPCVVVEVEVAVNLEEVPHAIVVIVNIKPIKDGIVVIVKVDG